MCHRRDEARLTRIMGKHFYLAVFGSIVGLCIAAFLFFTLMAKAWEAFGALGATILAMGLVVGVAYFFDRRTQQRAE
jgi:hypothetical protein